jgi:predicted aspartyl protease
MKVIFSICLALLLNLETTQSREKQQTTLPFKRMSNGCPVVTAVLNKSGRVKLMIDTGTNQSYLTDILVKRLGLKPSPLLDGKGNLIVSNGKEVRYLSGQQLELGSLHYRDSDLLVMDKRLDKGSISTLVNREVDGCIGSNYLAPYPLLLDFEADKVTFWSSGPLSPEELERAGMQGAVALTVERTPGDMPLLYLTAKLNGEADEKMILDTGSATSYISSSIAQKLKLTAIHTVKDHPTFGGKALIRLAKLDTLQLGSLRMIDQMVGFGEGESDGLISPIIGLDILRNFRVLIDIPGKKLYLKARARSSSSRLSNSNHW